MFPGLRRPDSRGDSKGSVAPFLPSLRLGKDSFSVDLPDRPDFPLPSAPFLRPLPPDGDTPGCLFWGDDSPFRRFRALALQLEFLPVLEK